MRGRVTYGSFLSIKIFTNCYFLNILIPDEHANIASLLTKLSSTDSSVRDPPCCRQNGAEAYLCILLGTVPENPSHSSTLVSPFCLGLFSCPARGPRDRTLLWTPSWWYTQIIRLRVRRLSHSGLSAG